MVQAFSGLSALLVIGVIGFLLARLGILTRQGDLVLQQTAFYVASPALMFGIIADADLSVMVTPGSAVFFGAAFITAVLFALFARFILKQHQSVAVMLSSTTGWVNANNIGLPVAVYVLADVDYIASVVILQLVVLAPIVVAALHFAAGGQSFWAVGGKTLVTPLIAATAAGIVVSLMGWQTPDFLFIPIEILSGAAIPLMLLALGAGMYQMQWFRVTREARPMVIGAVIAKGVVMPLLVWFGTKYLFGFDDHSVFALTTIAALPTAQNTYNFAVAFRVAEDLVRDILVYSTLAFLIMLVLLITLFT